MSPPSSELGASGEESHPAREGADASDGRFSLSLLHGVAVLRSFSADRDSIGVAQMADLVGLGRSTSFRYSDTLRNLGYLQQNRKRRYVLAANAANPGIAIIRRLRREIPAEEPLATLREETGYTVSMGVLDGTSVIYVHRLHAHRRGQHEIDRELRVGAHIPIHCTALGKVLLASLPESERRERIAGSELIGHTERTITDPDALSAELGDVNLALPLVSDEEFTNGARSIAMFVSAARDEKMRVAIDVTVPAAHLTAAWLRKLLGPRIRRAASAISEARRDQPNSE